jgi:hypothetical protein
MNNSGVVSESAVSTELVLVVVSDDVNNDAVNNGRRSHLSVTDIPGLCTHLHSEAVVLPDMLCSREWLVVRFRDPFAETVPDRVEVPPATHSTGV